MSTLTAVAEAAPAQVARYLADRLGPTKYGLWFDRTARLGIDADTLRVTVPSKFHADWITRHYHSEMQEAAKTASGRDLTVQVDVQPAAFRAHSPTPTVSTSADDDGANQSPMPALSERGSLSSDSNTSPTTAPRSPIDARFDFDQFVEGPSNAIACLAARRVAAGDRSFNPLFIHGECGVGKTHLLQAICRQINRTRPGAKWRYVTGEQFTNEYIAAVCARRLDAFRRTLRHLDFLALDDVHFLSAKNATQAEFLATIDAIDMTGARLVLASDGHPKRIRQVHERLVNRFMAGLVVEIRLPDLQTRRRILAQLSRQRGLRLSEPALDCLAERRIGSVRELEGAVAGLEALHHVARAGAPEVDRSVVGDEIGLVLVQRLLSGESDRPTRPPKADRIIAAAAARMGVSVPDLRGDGRHEAVVRARSVAAYLVRRLTNLSYPEIARAFGRKNHTTFIAAVDRVKDALDRENQARDAAANSSSGHDPSTAPDRESLSAIIESLVWELSRADPNGERPRNHE